MRLKTTGLILMISLFKVPLFFSITAALGYIYLGSESSPIYVYIMTFVGVLNIFLVIIYLWKRNRVRLRDIAVLIGVPAVIFLSYLLAEARYGSRFGNTHYLSLFLAFSFPALFIGYFFGKLKDHFDPSRVLEPIMLTISVGGIFSIVIPFLQGVRFVTLGGASYQVASYYAALAFGLNLYFLLWGINHKQYRLFRLLIYKVFCGFLLILQFIMVIIPGGRGAFVLVVVYCLAALWQLLREERSKKFSKFFLYGVIVAVVVFLIPTFMGNELFERGFNRVTAFISSTGINWDGTSGRLPIYQRTIEAFNESPIIGYGIFGYRGATNIGTYPHNLVLELLVQGGLVLFTISIILGIYLIRKLLFLIFLDSQYRVFLFIAIYPLVNLMFSGTYITSGLFWFMVAFLVTGPVSVKSRTRFRVRNGLQNNL